MPKIMKNINNISRAQAQLRAARFPDIDICPAHHTLLLAVSRMEGSTQEQIAKDICLSKSAASRALGQLEERGYIRRAQSPGDKRCFQVYLTEKAAGIMGKIRAVANEWNEIISDGLTEEEAQIFSRVIIKMEMNARRAIETAGAK